jgi:hypothetical protein
MTNGSPQRGQTGDTLIGQHRAVTARIRQAERSGATATRGAALLVVPVA